MSTATKNKQCIKSSTMAKDTSTSPIYRHSAPNKYDQYQQGTPCIVRKEQLYIQTSPDDNNPCWVLMGPYSPTKQL